MSEVRFEVDEKSLSGLNKFFLAFSKDVPKALRSAINTTASKTRKDLKNEAKSQYSIASGPLGNSQGMRLKRATNSRLEAAIFISGHPLLTSNYKHKANTKRKGAQVGVKKGRMVEIVNAAGNKAFDRGGITLQRKTNARTPLRATVGPSVPNIMRPEGSVYPKVEPTIQSELQKNVEAQIKKYL